MSTTSDPDRNLQHAIDKIHQASARGAQIVCLPELFQTQYFCQREDASLFDLAAAHSRPGHQPAGRRWRSNFASSLIASLFEKRAPGVYHNTAVVFDADGALRGLYRKMHIPDDPLYYEKYYFTPGDLGYRAFDTAVGRVGTLVCWDQWYPEGARLTALQGAEILFYPTAIGWHPSEKAEFGTVSARRLAHHPARPRHRQRRVCGGRKSRRTRNRRHPRQCRRRAMAWNSGAPRSSAIPSAASSPKHRTTKKKSWSPKSTSRTVEDVRRNWPFLRDRRIDSYGPNHQQADRLNLTSHRSM